MSKHRIVVIRGDGIGIEVVGEALKVLDAAGSKYGIEWTFDHCAWGRGDDRTTGALRTQAESDASRADDATLLGAAGQPDIQDHITLNGLLLPIRRTFDQYVCERPSVLYPGVTSPLSGKKPYDVDMVVIRENTEGEYTNMGGFMYEGHPNEVAVQTAVFTRRGCERVIRYAFDLARKRAKDNHVTSITKSNALGYSMVLWDRTFERVAQEYPDITTNSLLIDAACMDFIRRPEAFDVVVASNLFGDILTDIGAVIAGSMGLASSANPDPTRTNPPMFQPTPRTAPTHRCVMSFLMPPASRTT